MNTSPNAVTQLLIAWSQGDQAASDQLFSVVYNELRKLAHHHLRGERQNHTLLSSDLVNEAYLRLVGDQHFANRRHFLGVTGHPL